MPTASSESNKSASPKKTKTAPTASPSQRETNSSVGDSPAPPSKGSTTGPSTSLQTHLRPLLYWDNLDLGRVGGIILQDLGITSPTQWAGNLNNLGRTIRPHLLGEGEIQPWVVETILSMGRQPALATPDGCCIVAVRLAAVKALFEMPPSYK